MKKIMLLTMLTVASVFYVNAKIQDDSCGCKTTVSEKWDTLTICYYQHEILMPYQGNQIIKCGVYGADVWMLIHYKEIRCGNDVGIAFENATVYDWSNNYFNNQNGPCSGSPSDIPCNYTPSDFMTYYKQLQRKIIAAHGGSGLVNWVYPVGCMALAIYTYPAGATNYIFYPEGPNVGQIIAGGPVSPTVKLVPCKGYNCCRFTYMFDTLTNHLALVTAPTDVTCDGPVTIPPTDTIMCRDVNNNPVTYVGILTESGECKSFCNTAMSVMFKTGKINTGKIVNQNSFQPLPDPVNFNIAPTLAHDFITFTDTKNIYKIEVIDIRGKKVIEQSVFENNTMYISKLEDGIYYVKIYFNDTEIRSFKIFKQ